MKQVALAILLSSLICGCNAQMDISSSHVEANVPTEAQFDTYMKRDLTAHFCYSKCNVSYELLRKGATQSGVAYPKFYMWVRFDQDQKATEGAARIAAIDKDGFDVTNFMSREEILASPSAVSNIFPAALVPNILQRAKPVIK